MQASIMLPRTLMLLIGLAMLALVALAHDASAEPWAEVAPASHLTSFVDLAFDADSIHPPYQSAMGGCTVDCPEWSLLSADGSFLGPISRVRAAWFLKVSLGTLASGIAPAVPPPRI